MAGYFIGEGLKHINNPKANEKNDIMLIKERDIYFYIGHFLGITQAEAKLLAKDLTDLPHIDIDGKRYVQKHILREWVLTLGEKQQAKD